MSSDAAETASAYLSPRQALSQVPWLDHVPDTTLDSLANAAVLHVVPAGSILFRQAETPAFAQFLIGGSVELLAVRDAEESLVELIRPHDLLLPAAVLNRQPYLLRARVHEAAHLVMVQAKMFRRAVASDQPFCLAVLACQAAQFRRQVKHIKNVELRSAEERVGCYLLDLLRTSESGRTVRLALEKRRLASQLGMTRETLSRALAAMPRFGLRIEKDSVILVDAAVANARFRLDPLIDGAEPVTPLPHQEPLSIKAGRHPAAKGGQA